MGGGRKTKSKEDQDEGLVVLVTGGSGMLGSFIVELLLTLSSSARLPHRIAEVRVLDLTPFTRLGSRPGETASNHELGAHVPKLVGLVGDVTDVECVSRACEGVDFVFHACSVVDFGNIPRETIYR
jgi:nucleoside-diphosphate-sugar epimerase